jgi:thioredoxin reductase
VSGVGGQHSRYLIVGAGPAGLQLGYFLERSGQDYLIVEAADVPGAFFRTYPRRRELISFNKTHSVYQDPEVRLRWDWNSLLTDDGCYPFERYSRRLYPTADEMLTYLAAFAEQFGLRVAYGCRVHQVTVVPGGGFRVDAGPRRFSCRYLVVATGLPQPYVPPIPGIEHSEGYESVALDPASYEGQRVLIIGKGNSGFEIADTILDHAALVHLASPHPLRFAWQTRHPGHLRGQYSRILDMYQLKTLNGALDCVIDSIAPEGGELVASITYSHADGEQEQLAYDRVVRCTGFRFDADPFATCQPAPTGNGRLPDMTSEWESVNIPNLFYAGTLMQARDYRRASSAFIDGFRYNIRTLHALLGRREGGSLGCQELAGTADTLEAAVIERVSRTSALWAQFGFLCDVLVVNQRTGRAAHYYELPKDWVLGPGFGHEPHYYTISFEWGTWPGDVFSIERHPHAETASTNVFLHPVVRRYAASRQLAEHHVLEDLFGMYCAEGESGTARTRSGRDMRRYHLEEHRLPLRRFFAGSLG